MKAQEIRALSDEQLRDKILAARKEQMNLRFQKASGQLENFNRWRELRTDVARLKTEQTARVHKATQATAAAAK